MKTSIFTFDLLVMIVASLLIAWGIEALFDPNNITYGNVCKTAIHSMALACVVNSIVLKVKKQ